MTTLVAGGAGFVGSRLCRRLLAMGETVVGMDNLSTGRIANILPLMEHPAFTFLCHDIVEPLPSLPKLHQIYHLASPASPPAYQCRPIETLRVNSEGTFRLLELARSHEARFLFASTSEVYGDPLVHPQPEGYWGHVSSTGPRSMYDESKRYGEAITTVYSQEYDLDVRIARIFNTYGPGMDANDGRVVSNFIVQALRGEPLTVYGDGSQTRSFQYVDDLIDALVRLMASSFRSPINIGNPEEYRVLELAHLIQCLTGTEVDIAYLPLPGHDPKQRRPDIALAKAVLGWEPQVPVTIGLTKTIAYFQEELMTVPGGRKQSTLMPITVTSGEHDAAPRHIASPAD